MLSAATALQNLTENHAAGPEFEARLERLKKLALVTLECILADEKASAGVRLRAALFILKPPAPAKTKSDTNAAAVDPQTPRGAPCPCGSGLKYKRCCGINAPPVLQAQAA